LFLKAEKGKKIKKNKPSIGKEREDGLHSIEKENRRRPGREKECRRLPTGRGKERFYVAARSIKELGGRRAPRPWRDGKKGKGVS